MAGDLAPEMMSFCNYTESTATLSLEVSNYLELKGGEPVSSPVFKVGGYDWEMEFYPDGYDEDSDGYASCYIYYLNEADDVMVKSSFSMLARESQEEVASYDVCTRVFASGDYDQDSWGYDKFVDKAKLESLSQQGDGCFTILCVLTVRNESQQTPLPLELPSHLEGMLRDDTDMDVTFKVGGQEYRAHRFVLAARSPVFRASVCGQMKEKDMRCIDVVDMEPSIFEMMLRYIYTGSLPECQDKGGYSAAVMQHLLVAADWFGLDRMKLMCEKELCKKMDARTITTTMELADQHEWKPLKDACLKFVAIGRRRLRPRA